MILPETSSSSRVLDVGGAPSSGRTPPEFEQLRTLLPKREGGMDLHRGMEHQGVKHVPDGGEEEMQHGSVHEIVRQVEVYVPQRRPILRDVNLHLAPRGLFPSLVNFLPVPEILKPHLASFGKTAVAVREFRKPVRARASRRQIHLRGPIHHRSFSRRQRIENPPVAVLDLVVQLQNQRNDTRSFRTVKTQISIVHEQTHQLAFELAIPLWRKKSVFKPLGLAHARLGTSQNRQ